MSYTFALTIIFIVLATMVGAFVRRISRDKCLNDFCRNQITLEQTDGRLTSGILRVENTGLELVYGDKASGSKVSADDNQILETSIIVYKQEYARMQGLIRYHDELSESDRLERDRQLTETYHPRFFRRLNRRIKNFFKAVRDSLLEVVNLLISQAKKTTSAGGVLSSQDKYVTKMKKELAGSVGVSFEPLLERYIGHRVVLEMSKGDKMNKYWGVLKDYTAEFIEIMDVDYQVNESVPVRKADLVVPRKYGVVRHLGE